MAKFNVILPTIGRDTLPYAVDSVLNQSYNDFVLIIAADSKYAFDASEQFLIDQRVINVWDGNLAPHNDSGAFCRNYAIDFVKGEGQWITYIDCDDEWYKDRLKLFNQFIEEHKEANSPLDKFFSYGKLLKWKHVHPRSSEKVLKPIQEIQDVTCGGMCHTVDLFRKTKGWSSVNKTTHDRDLWDEMSRYSIGSNVLKKVTYKFILDK